MATEADTTGIGRQEEGEAESRFFRLQAWLRQTDFFSHLILAVVTFIVLLPLLWIISTSFKDRLEFSTNSAALIPSSFSLVNYLYMFEAIQLLPIYMRNSFILAGGRDADPGLLLGAGRLRIRPDALLGSGLYLHRNHRFDVRAQGRRADGSLRADDLPQAAKQPLRPDPPFRRRPARRHFHYASGLSRDSTGGRRVRFHRRRKLVADLLANRPAPGNRRNGHHRHPRFRGRLERLHSHLYHDRPRCAVDHLCGHQKGSRDQLRIGALSPLPQSVRWRGPPTRQCSFSAHCLSCSSTH